MSLESIKFTEDPIQLVILNQLLVPYQTEYIRIDSIAPGPDCEFSGYDAIKGMYTRGAPAIMLVGCFSVVVELDRVINKDEAETFGYDLADELSFKRRLIERIDKLIKSRPTAVNLANGCNRIKQIVEDHHIDRNYELLFSTVLVFSRNLLRDDLQANLSIGENGVRYIYDELTKENFKGDFSVMTICNTGSLATSGHGTALGIIRSLFKKARGSHRGAPFKLSHVYACETRPYNQGSRLTAYELQYENIPFTLITDNMASFLIESLNDSGGKARSRGLADSAPVKFIIVGADRIVKNGDLANKIGTFQLSLIASQYTSVKFIGAAPSTTIDHVRTSGDEIVIEQRPQRELTEVRGGEVNDCGEFVIDSTTGNVKLTKVKLAPQGIDVWNPSFDVTPHKYIDCIVTEHGYMTKDPNGGFNL
ncbi:DEKNAAC101710 [Brettanomyces naardenensis]|uniref:Methylthioribose-1-phosphate isomerase n=1 Tax=Brettanomyces naardenensis TaxID=13370 RepID=A0A448YIV0_BRENA|nr:DEKNAAC101710 [Brettanomyces naardenensis]